MFTAVFMSSATAPLLPTSLPGSGPPNSFMQAVHPTLSSLGAPLNPSIWSPTAWGKTRWDPGQDSHHRNGAPQQHGPLANPLLQGQATLEFIPVLEKDGSLDLSWLDNRLREDVKL